MIALTKDIVAKVSHKTGQGYLDHEQSILARLEETPCKYILKPFLCRKDVTFMKRLDGGILYERMGNVDKQRPVLLWMQQLSAAAAWVELQGFAHGDINPRNIIFDDNDQLKLIDFDHAVKIGDDIDVGEEPYVACRSRHSVGGGQYGIAGPVTELLALGSIFWYMSRGTELYHDVEGPDKVDHLIKHRFPAMDTTDPIDDVISRCWHGGYKTVGALASHVQSLDQPFDEKKRECLRIYELSV